MRISNLAGAVSALLLAAGATMAQPAPDPSTQFPNPGGDITGY